MIKLRLFARRAMMFTAIAVTTSVILLSCKKDAANNSNANNPAAGLMVVNLAPDKTAVGFSIDGNAINGSSLGYESFNGGYAGIYPGQRTISAYDFYSPSGVIASSASPVTFENGKYYSAFLIGAAGNYKTVVAADAIDSLTATAGKAFLRYINAIPDSVSQAVVTITPGTASPVMNAAAFGTISPFGAVNTGNLTIAIKNSNGIDANRTLTMEQSKLYTVLFSGIPGSTTTPVEIKFIVNGTLDSTQQAPATTGLAGAVITK